MFLSIQRLRPGRSVDTPPLMRPEHGIPSLNLLRKCTPPVSIQRLMRSSNLLFLTWQAYPVLVKTFHDRYYTQGKSAWQLLRRYATLPDWRQIAVQRRSHFSCDAFTRTYAMQCKSEPWQGVNVCTLVRILVKTYMMRAKTTKQDTVQEICCLPATLSVQCLCPVRTTCFAIAGALSRAVYMPSALQAKTMIKQCEKHTDAPLRIGMPLGTSIGKDCVSRSLPYAVQKRHEALLDSTTQLSAPRNF